MLRGAFRNIPSSEEMRKAAVILSEPYKTTFVLYFVSNLRISDIAIVEDCSCSTIQRRIAKALNEINKCSLSIT